MTIKLTQEYEIEMPIGYENKSKEGILNELNFMYDINGKDILSRNIDINDDSYTGTRLVSIGDEDVYLEYNTDSDKYKVSRVGTEIYLDGQQL